MSVVPVYCPVLVHSVSPARVLKSALWVSPIVLSVTVASEEDSRGCGVEVGHIFRVYGR